MSAGTPDRFPQFQKERLRIFLHNNVDDIAFFYPLAAAERKIDENVRVFFENLL